MKRCAHCGLVYISDKSHITEDFYKESNMIDGESRENPTKWEKINKNDTLRRIRTFKNNIVNKRILDVGCGAGGFIKRALAYAEKCSAVEVDLSLIKHLRKNIKGVEFYDSISSVPKVEKFDYIFLFHVLEHLPDPVAYINYLFGLLECGGSIIIEVPNADDALCSLYDCKEFKDFFYWSCHLYYFDHNTLAKLASKTDLNLEYIKQVQRYPLSNHLYWLKEGKPGGHTKLSYLDTDILNSEYEKSLASIGKCDTLIMKLTRKDNDN